MILVPSAQVSSDRMTSTKLKNKFSSMRGFLSKAADDLADKAAETKNKMERNLERRKLNLPIPERSEDNVSIKSDRSSINEADQQTSDPGTPEAMLSDKLFVSVINASNMSGERSSTGRTSPTAPPFRSPANSFTKHADRSRSNSKVKGVNAQASSVNQTEADEPDTEGVTATEKESTAIAEDNPKETFSSAIEVTELKGRKHSAADRAVSIVITEDPGEDQSAKVMENLSKRLSYASKSNPDTFENIGSGFSSSIVFQTKPKSKTKKKKKTVKGEYSTGYICFISMFTVHHSCNNNKRRGINQSRN